MAVRDRLIQVCKEPLTHFVVVGSILYAILSSIDRADTSNAEREVVVTREALTRYLEFRAKVIEPEAFARKLDGMSTDEIRALIDNFVREEVLYREAGKLGLDKNDYGARRRLIQQLEFVNQGVIASTIGFSEQDLRTYLENHQDRYTEPATITFTHVFINRESIGRDKASKHAEGLLKTLNREPPVPFHNASAYGDRFLFHRNYVGKDTLEIESHFGPAMQRQLFQLQPSEEVWRGPFDSPYGSHLILLTKKTEPRLPDFSTLKSRLENDYYQLRLDEEISRIEKSVIDSYSIDLEPEIEQRLTGVSR